MAETKSKKQMGVQFGLCIDWETSGATFNDDSSKYYQGIEFGAIVFDAKTFEPIEKLKLYIKYDEAKYGENGWTDAAFRIHGLSKEFLDENGVTQEEAAITLAELILKYWGPSTKVLLLGHNVEFDIRFTNQLLNTIDIEFSIEPSGKFDSRIQIFHVILDTSALGFITLGAYKSDLLFEKIGFDSRGNHDALEDAEQTLMTCKVIRQLVELGLNG